MLGAEAKEVQQVGSIGTIEVAGYGSLEVGAVVKLRDGWVR